MWKNNIWNNIGDFRIRGISILFAFYRKLQGSEHLLEGN